MRYSILTRFIPLVAAAFAVTACDEAGPRTQTLYEAPNGTLDKIRFSTHEGKPVPVYVFAAPFSDDATVAQTYAELLGKDDPTISFVSAGAGIPDVPPPLRVLLLHDAPKSYTGNAACKGRAYDPEPAEKEVRLNAIICEGEDRLIEVLGTLPRDVANLGAEYDALVEQTARAIVVQEVRSQNK